MEILVQYKAKVNIRNMMGETPLHLAAENAKGEQGEESHDLVEYLVEK